MSYCIETRRLHTSGYWLGLGTVPGLVNAKVIAQDMAVELQREVRIVRYGRPFEVIAEFRFSALEQPLRMEADPPEPAVQHARAVQDARDKLDRASRTGNNVWDEPTWKID